MIEEIDVNVFLDDNLGPRKILSGEEYFETNPNDFSYDVDSTNKDLCGGPNEYTLDAVSTSPRAHYHDLNKKEYTFDAVIISPRENNHEFNLIRKEPFKSNYKRCLSQLCTFTRRIFLPQWAASHRSSKRPKYQEKLINPKHGTKFFKENDSNIYILQ